MITAILVDPQGKTITAEYNHEDPGAGNTWLTKLDGWTGGVSVKGEQLSRAGHGDFPLRGFRTRRTMTMGFTAERDSRQELWALERGLSGLFSDGGFGSLTVIQDGVELSCEVELDGEVTSQVFLDGGVLNAEIPLTNPSPWLYGPWKTTQLDPQDRGIGLAYDLFSVGGVLTFGTDVDSSSMLWNDGNADSYPIFTVFADSPGGFRVRLGDRTIAWPRPTFKSTPVEVHWDGKVMVSGYDQSQYLTERGWSSIPPHSMTVASFELLQGGFGWCNAAFRDTNS